MAKYAPRHLPSESGYSFMVVADLDHDSYDPIKRKGKSDKPRWSSRIQRGVLTRSGDTYNIQWKNIQTIYSGMSESGRGMELSELVSWFGKLYTFDDRTGLVFELAKDQDTSNHIVPLVRYVLINGDGTPDSNGKGFKSEWATVKDSSIYVGSMGKEYTAPDGSNKVLSNAPMWIKRIYPSGHIQHIDWTHQYNALRKAIPGTSHPNGYMVHESALWSDYHKRWIFAPRRVSDTPYNEDDDETRGSNWFLVTDDSFRNVEAFQLGTATPERGFSSIKFIPGTRDQHIIALKSVELNGKIETYIAIYDWVNQVVLMEETRFSTKYKFEGLEFL